MKTIRELRERPPARGFIRRLAVKLTGVLWQLLGYEDADGNRETFDKTEVFHNIGFTSRPRAGFGEAVVVNVGGESNHPVVIASRDQSIVVTIEEDETVIHNSTSGAIVRLTKTGQVLLGGMAASFAVPRDSLRTTLNTFITAYNAHTHSDPQGGTTGPPLVSATSSPASDLSPNVKVS